jgi:hypothetical protein
LFCCKPFGNTTEKKKFKIKTGRDRLLNYVGFYYDLTFERNSCASMI